MGPEAHKQVIQIKTHVQEHRDAVRLLTSPMLQVVALPGSGGFCKRLMEPRSCYLTRDWSQV